MNITENGVTRPMTKDDLPRLRAALGLDASEEQPAAEEQSCGARCARAGDSEEPRPAASYPDEELVNLYQEICARVGVYKTQKLIERMFELRAELLKRLATRPNKL